MGKNLFIHVKKNISFTKKGFTLIEVIIAMTLFFVLLAAIISIYTRMVRLKYNIQARTNIVQDSYFVIEKINLMLKDYTIDYEEYFNRKNVGCDTYNANFTRDVGSDGYCNIFTAYGNHSNIDLVPSTTRKIYFCSSTIGQDIPYKVIQNPEVQDGSGCLNTGRQSFGQYQRQFRDVKNNVDSVPGAGNDDDDENVMKWPNAIDNATGAQEIYLISQDGKSRIFIRRALIESGDRNNTGGISGDSEKLYTLQILKLRGFDAGNNHDFNVNTSSGVYDGKIDTRACDYAQGFICQGSWVDTSVYKEYKLPADENDGWANLFKKNITISDRNLMVYPTKNPQYALTENNAQINPYFTMSIISKLYGKIRQKRLGIPNLDTFKIGVQTTFNTKNFYTK